MCGKNGDIICLIVGSVGVVDEVLFGILVKDGVILDDLEVIGVKEWCKLFYVGVVVIVLVVNKLGDFLDDLEIVLFGLLDMDDVGELMEDIVFKVVIGVVISIFKVWCKDKDLIGEVV